MFAMLGFEVPNTCNHVIENPTINAGVPAKFFAF
jgi:hypothetical protein